MKRLEIGVIGLGKFGFQLALSLTDLGHRVLGLDNNEGHAQRANGKMSAVYQGDATDKTVLEQLRFQDLDCVAVSIGQSMEASLLIALNLQEIGARDIIVKAVSPQHATVLQRLGVQKVVQPEQEAAVQTAQRLHNPGMLDLLPVGGGVLVQRLTVNRWSGKTLADLSLPKMHGSMVVARRRDAKSDFQFVPDPLQPLEAGEELLLIGPPERILKLEA